MEICEYQNTPGCYVLIHQPSGLFYIGSSGNMKRRLRKHNDEFRTKTHHCKRLLEVYRDWGDFEVRVTYYDTLTVARDEEQRLLDLNYGKPKCCNVGTGASVLWLRGRPKEVSDRIAAKQRGRKVTDQFRESCRVRQTGVRHTDSQKSKISAALKGRIMTDEHKANISAGQKGKLRGPKPVETERKRQETIAANGGFNHTEDSRRKIAEFNMKPIVVDGIEYASLQVAAKELNVSPSTITNRINSNNPKFAGYVFKTK